MRSRRVAMCRNPGAGTGPAHGPISSGRRSTSTRPRRPARPRLAIGRPASIRRPRGSGRRPGGAPLSGPPHAPACSSSQAVRRFAASESHRTAGPTSPPRSAQESRTRCSSSGSRFRRRTAGSSGPARTAAHRCPATEAFRPPRRRRKPADRTHAATDAATSPRGHRAATPAGGSQPGRPAAVCRPAPVTGWPPR